MVGEETEVCRRSTLLFTDRSAIIFTQSCSCLLQGLASASQSRQETEATEKICYFQWNKTHHELSCCPGTSDQNAFVAAKAVFSTNSELSDVIRCVFKEEHVVEPGSVWCRPHPRLFHHYREGYGAKSRSTESQSSSFLCCFWPEVYVKPLWSGSFGLQTAFRCNHCDQQLDNGNGSSTPAPRFCSGSPALLAVKLRRCENHWMCQKLCFCTCVWEWMCLWHIELQE